MRQGWIKDTFESKYHYIDGRLHNDAGPAIICTNGTKYWYKNGKRHRDNGAAIEWSDGKKEWWYEGKFLAACYEGLLQEDFDTWLKFKAFI